MHIHNLKTLMSPLKPRRRAVKNKVINKDTYNPSIGIIFHFRFQKMTNLLLTLRLLIRLLLLHLHKKNYRNPVYFFVRLSWRKSLVPADVVTPTSRV